MEDNKYIANNFLVVDSPEGAGTCRCVKCRQFNENASLYIIMEAMDRLPNGDWTNFGLPRGFVCGGCAASLKEAMHVWKEHQ